MTQMALSRLLNRIADSSPQIGGVVLFFTSWIPLTLLSAECLAPACGGVQEKTLLLPVQEALKDPSDVSEGVSIEGQVEKSPLSS